LKRWLNPLAVKFERVDGSRVVLELSGKREYVHRPHPGKEARKYLVEKIREWLTSLEVTP